jgi:hypothetical protein
MLRRFVPVVGRRIGVLVLGMVTGVLSAGVVRAQDAAKPSGPYVATTEGMIFVHVIKGENTADYEAAMGKVKDALAKSEKPERKQQAAGWKLFKASEPGPSGAAIYVWTINPAVMGADYNLFAILNEGFPQEAAGIYDKLKDAFVAQQKFSLTLKSDFSK